MSLAPGARERVLALIRARQGKPAHAHATEVEEVQGHLGAHPRSPAPPPPADRLAAFRARALTHASTLDDAATPLQAPARIAAYLRERSLPLRAVCWRTLVELDWAGSGMEVEARSARADDLVGITTGYCAIAETGTLMTLSGPETPATVSLLPETHIAIVSAARVVDTMEDAWALLRRDPAGVPRAVNFISGPSRTADIEQTLTLGAHGPYRVHIILTAS